MFGHPDVFQRQSNLLLIYEVKSLSAFSASLRCNKTLFITQNRTLEIIPFHIFLITEVEAKQFICRGLFLNMVEVREYDVQYDLLKL